MILIILTIIFCISILALILIQTFKKITLLYFKEDIDNIMMNKIPSSKIEFTLYKDNVKIGDYVYYGKDKNINKDTLEYFVREHICNFFNRMEITYPK